MSEVFVIGSGMTRFGKFPERSLRDLSEEAVGAALADAVRPVRVRWHARSHVEIQTGKP